MTPKVWLITGCSSGFGKEMVRQLLADKQTVVATARNVNSLDEFKNKCLCLTLDVTNGQQINDVVVETMKQYGRIDVLVNNAGYGQMGALEEATIEEILQQMETNVMGVVRLTKAVIPIMRQQCSGTIQVLSSVAGLVGSAGATIYNASKFALEGMFEGLATELKQFNINVSIVEPGPFRTAFLDYSLKQSQYLDAYANSTTGRTREFLNTGNGMQIGDPVLAVKYMLEVCTMPQPPLRLVLGKSAYERYQTKLNNELAQLEQWKHYSLNADYKE